MKRVVKLARFYTCEYQTLLSYEKIVTQAYQKKEFRVVQVGVESKTFYWKPVGAIVDKSPWDTVVMRRIICVLQTKFEKSAAILLKTRCFFPSPPNSMLKIRRNYRH